MALARLDCCGLTANIIGVMGGADHCAELQQLKLQYELALRVWGEYLFPAHNEPVGTPGWRSEKLWLQLKERALDARNAANERLFNHKRTCPLCAAGSNSSSFYRGETPDSP
jgi:hypothetical protein